MKLIKYLFFSSILTSTLAFAQHRFEVPSVDDVNNVAKQVEKLVERHGETLPAFELNRIYRDLNRIARTFEYYGLDLEVDIPLRICNRERMVELDGTLIYKFTFSSDCTDVLDRANSGKPFCDRNKMVDAYGKNIHKFTFSSDCEENLVYIETGKHFCDGKVLYNSLAQRKQSFTFSSDCELIRDQINAQ